MLFQNTQRFKSDMAKGREFEFIEYFKISKVMMIFQNKGSKVKRLESGNSRLLNISKIRKYMLSAEKQR